MPRNHIPSPSPLELAALRSSHDYRDALKADIMADKTAEMQREAVQNGQILLQPVQQSQQPQTAVTPPAGQPGPTPEQTQGNVEQAPNTRLYANKFETPEKMEEGYYQLLNFASQLNRQLNAAQPHVPEMVDTPQFPQMIPGSSPGAAPRVNPGARTPVDWKSNGAVVKLADKLAAQPEDLSEFAQAVTDHALQSVDQRVQQELAPLQTQMAMDAADRLMSQRYPEYTRFAPEMVMYLQIADPIVQGTFRDLLSRGAYVAASEYAWTMFQRQTQTLAHGQIVAESQIAEGNRQTARANAAVSPSSPGTPIHAAIGRDLGPDPQTLDNLRERARAGDQYAAIQLRRETFGRLMSPEMQASWQQ